MPKPLSASRTASLVLNNFGSYGDTHSNSTGSMRTEFSVGTGIKTTAETRDRFYKASDERKVPVGELLLLALDALDRAGR